MDGNYREVPLVFLWVMLKLATVILCFENIVADDVF